MRAIAVAAVVSVLAACATLYPTADEFAAAVDGWVRRGQPMAEARERLTAEGFRCRPGDDPKRQRCERTGRTYFCGQSQTVVLVDDGQGRVAAVERNVRGGLRPLAC